MSTFIINGAKKLKGEIKTNSAKNSAVAILCATPMIVGKTILEDVPVIEEVKRIIEILESIGLKIEWTGKHQLTITNDKKIDLKKINAESFVKTRSGLLLIGSLVSVFKKFTLPKSSGCQLGIRTVSPYIMALEHLGIEVKYTKNFYEIARKKLKATEFTMYESGDTATENTIMAAVLIPGKTIINFASANYMVQDLCHFLNAAGAKIKGIGSSRLEIDGVKSLKPVKVYSIMPDPIESMAFISLAITTGAELKVSGCPIDFLRLELEKLRAMGQKFIISQVYKSKNGKFNLADIKIIPSILIALPDKIHPMPYPGLNIDNLPLFAPILTQVKGESLLHDWVYENRAAYYTELNKLGAHVNLLDQHRALISGPTKLKPAEVACPPALRPSINLLIGMLSAKGRSILKNSYSIDRGYENIVERLNKIGADIKRVDD